MLARLFRSIKKILSSLPKVVLLPLVFLLLFLVRTAPAFADINTYKNLFLQGSSLTYTGPILDSTNSLMAGGIFKLNLGFSSNPTTPDAIQTAWSHVATDYYTNDRVVGNATGAGFILRICTTTGNTPNCAYFKLTYDNYVNEKAEYTASNPYVIYREAPNYENQGLTGKIGEGLRNGSGAVVKLIAGDEFSYISNNSITITAPGSVPNFDEDGSPDTSSPTYNNQSIFTISSDGSINPTGLNLPLTGGNATADVWYCASNTSDDQNATSEKDPSVQQFGDLCGGTDYYQATPTITISIPQSASDATSQATAASTQAAAAAAASITQSKTNELTSCGIVPGLDKGTINGCLAQVAYGIYQLCAWIAGLFGELFDFFIGYSVSSASYSYPFVVTGWTLVRNISNIFFIVIMVWTGFSAVFNIGKTSMKSVVTALIINAFLINFSLFFTRVVIDISNIGARMFYSEMLVCKQTDLVKGVCPAAKAQTGLGGYWPLSEKIVSSFDPQAMFKSSILTPPSTSTDGAQNLTQQTANTLIQDSPRTVSNYYAIISLIAAAIMITIAVMFFKVSFLFLGRVVGLYICMIFSPFAFLSRDIPMLGTVPRLRWEDWKKELTSYALLAPVFTFFLYIIYTFLSSNFIQQIGVQALTSAGFFPTVMSILIPMLIIYFLIDAAQKTAVKLSGEIGAVIQKYGEAATGLVGGVAVGLATGGASLAGTSLTKYTALSDQKRAELQAQQATGGWRGKLASAQLKSSDWTQRQTFDARNTQGVQFLNKKFGLNPNNDVVKALRFGSDRTKGGRAGQIKRSADKTTKKIKSIKTDIDDTEAAGFWQKHLQKETVQKNIEQEAAVRYQQKYGKKVTDKNSAEFQEQKKAVVDSFGKVGNNKELTQAMRLQYANTLKNNPLVPINDMLALPLLAGAAIDNTGKKVGASEYIKEQAKQQKKVEGVEKKHKEKVEKLTKVKEKEEKELEAIEKILEKTYRVVAKQEVDRDPAHSAKSAAEKQTLVETRVQELKKEENADKATEVLKQHRINLENKIEEAQFDKETIHDQQKALLKKNKGNKNDPAVVALQEKLAAKIAEQNVLKREYEDNDPNTKTNLQNKIRDRENELDKLAESKEGALEKLAGAAADKDKKADDKDSKDDKDKDDKK